MKSTEFFLTESTFTCPVFLKVIMSSNSTTRLIGKGLYEINKNRKSTSLLSQDTKQIQQQSNYIKNKYLLTQIIRNDNCKPFRKLLELNNPLYKYYKSINPNPISFSYVFILSKLCIKHQLIIFIIFVNRYNIKTIKCKSMLL